MNKAEVIKLLSDYNWIKRSIEDANKEIEINNDAIEAARELSGIDYSTEKVGCTNKISDMTFNAAIRVEKLSDNLEYWNDRLEELYEKERRINRWLDLLSAEERMIIEYKNIKNMKWYMVASVMNYSERQCRRIGNEAIKKIICP